MTRLGAVLSTGESIRPISADSHIVEPGNCYIDNIESKYAERAPRIIRSETADGLPMDAFLIDGLSPPISVMSVSSAGRDPSESFHAGTVEDARQGGWDPHARIADQDRDGIAAEMLYPSIGMVLCSHTDIDYKHACMWAYNRWLQKFCSAYPDRLFGLGQTSARDVKEIVADLQKFKNMGFKGIMLPGFPATEEDYSHASYDAVWEASVDLDMPITFHILTTNHPKSGKNWTDPDFRGNSRMNAFHGLIRGVQDILGMFVFDGILDRFPDLKVVCTEADAGWVPHFMHRMDHVYHRFFGTLKGVKFSKTPSEFFRENFYVTFQDDWSAFKMAHLMNPKRLMWANDYPHSDSTWPNSQPLLQSHTSDLQDEDKRAILRDNVTQLYKLEAAVFAEA